MRKTALALLLFCLSAVALMAADKSYKVQSPSGGLAIEISAGKQLTWSVSREGVKLLSPSAVSMTLDDGSVLGKDVKVRKAAKRNVSRTITPAVYRQAEVKEAYNELTLQSSGYSVVFRAYDEGAAYRFVASRKAPFKVVSEQAEFSFPQDCQAFIPYTKKRNDTFECQFFTSFENLYERQNISEWKKGRLAFLPITLDAPGGMKVCITESDLLNYPGMYLSNEDGDSSLEAVFAPYPKEVEQGGHNMLEGLVKSREPYIAQAAAGERFPWRIVVVAKEDKDLLACDLPWLLGSEPAAGADFSWVKPGKVAWDWWNAWNIYGVDFESGVNNDTYKYYIDFAAGHGIEYVILDEGWAVNKKADLFQVVPEIDLPMLCNYAGGKGVGIILWAGYWAFDKDMERACREYSEMGVKGFKVDFMDRDDQPMVDFYRRAAETAARYHLLVDFHGAFKPAGLQRTWPNVLNFEGVYGLENAKGQKNEIDLVTYEATIPYVRLVAGPADYTQGAMRNATKGNFRFVSSEAMSQGTRCRQLAEYMIFDAPLSMLCDSPSNYMKEPACLKFIAEVPTVWDETVALEGKAGEYVAMARRKGDTWYVGAITDWNTRELTLDLSFIGGKPAMMEVFSDGANAHKAARDYKQQWPEFPADGKVSVKMAPGGGWAAVIRQQPESPEKTDKDWPRFSYYEAKNVAHKAAVEDGSKAKPVAVLFGDSITRNWVRCDAEWLDAHNFVGRGIGGQTTMHMLSRFRPDVIELEPEYVVILAGINDIARNNGYIKVEHIFGNLVSMVELAKANGIKPVMCTVLPAREIGWRMRVGDPRPSIDSLNVLIRGYAAENHIPLAEYHDAMMTPEGGMIPAYETDAVHPNLAGYKVMEKVLLETLGKN